MGRRKRHESHCRPVTLQLEASCGGGAGCVLSIFPLQSGVPPSEPNESKQTTNKGSGGKGEQESLPLPSRPHFHCLLVLVGFFFARGEALLLLLSFLPDLPPLSLSLLRCCIASLAGGRGCSRGGGTGEACWGPPPESSSAAIGGGDGRRGKDTCKPTQVC